MMKNELFQISSNREKKFINWIINNLDMNEADIIIGHEWGRDFVNSEMSLIVKHRYSWYFYVKLGE